jgi:hypothetical protein
MNALHLLWIVPTCTVFGLVLGTLFSVNQEEDDYEEET